MMEFSTVSKLKRPVRLSEETREFAYESLHCRYGRNTRETPYVSLDGIENADGLEPIDLYDAAISAICRSAPLRICKNELLSGAATLGEAIEHHVPAYRNGKPVFRSVSHLTVDFETVLKEGLNAYSARIEKSAAVHRGKREQRFLQSCRNCISAFSVWHSRYLKELSDKPQYKKNYENLLRVPLMPAESFYQAVQSLWFTFAFIRLCGNWPGIGRIDKILGPYLKKDLENGSITIDEAREILAHFFIKGCEWICGGNYGSGDAQHYQNIVLAGVDEKGEEVTNEVTYLVLEVVEELGIGDFPISVRINKNTDQKLLRKIAEVIRYGGGIVAVYDEDTVLSALEKDGYAEEEARAFANDGCWEVQVPGATAFEYVPFDSLQILQHQTLNNYQCVSFESFHELYEAYRRDLNDRVNGIYEAVGSRTKATSEGFAWAEREPCTVVSLFENDCIGNARSYYEGGTRYNIVSPHIGGVIDTANSLYAIKKYVFDEKRCSFPEFMKMLEMNWQGYEAERLRILNGYRFYGNDNDEADRLVAQVLHDFAAMCRRLNGRCGYHFPAGVSTFGRQIEWAPERSASPHGHRAHDILSANASPTPGSAPEGITATVKSYCKTDWTEFAGGSALDIKFMPAIAEGEEGIDAVAGLIRGFVKLGGFFFQPDVLDVGVLREAQKTPEKYSDLSVRVSGWNARFVTLDKNWQEMVICAIDNEG